MAQARQQVSRIELQTLVNQLVDAVLEERGIAVIWSGITIMPLPMAPREGCNWHAHWQRGTAVDESVEKAVALYERVYTVCSW